MSKETGLGFLDNKKFSPADVTRIARVICEILSVRNYPSDYVYGILRDYREGVLRSVERKNQVHT